MKIRIGFVSNSSSSSFVLFGVKIAKHIDRALEVKLMEAFGYDWKRKAEELDAIVTDPEEQGDELDGDDLEDEVFEDFLSNHLEPKKHLTIVDDAGGKLKDAVYLGRMIKPDECYGREQTVFKVDEITKIVDDINKRMKTKHKAEVIIGNRYE